MDATLNILPEASITNTRDKFPINYSSTQTILGSGFSFQKVEHQRDVICCTYRPLGKNGKINVSQMRNDEQRAQHV